MATSMVRMSELARQGPGGKFTPLIKTPSIKNEIARPRKRNAQQGDNICVNDPDEDDWAFLSQACAA
jgi:hypothetical protein